MEVRTNTKFTVMLGWKNGVKSFMHYKKFMGRMTHRIRTLQMESFF